MPIQYSRPATNRLNGEWFRLDPDRQGGDDQLIRQRIPPDGEPSAAVIRAVAAVEGVEPTELDVLYDTIDPDAIDQLAGIGNEGVKITFQYNGYEITVRGDDVLFLWEADSAC